MEEKSRLGWAECLDGTLRRVSVTRRTQVQSLALLVSERARRGVGACSGRSRQAHSTAAFRVRAGLDWMRRRVSISTLQRLAGGVSRAPRSA
jgi:hypothetical protein